MDVDVRYSFPQLKWEDILPQADLTGEKTQLRILEIDA
jgi:hypothetical protein